MSTLSGCARCRDFADRSALLASLRIATLRCAGARPREISALGPLYLMTHSESVFERICREVGYEVERPLLRCREGIKTADFEITASGQCLIAEVEELRPNRDDMRQIQAMQDGIPVGGGCTIGARPRKHIRRAAEQLKPYAHRGVPMLVVLYDNVRVGNTRVAYPMFYLQSHDIDAAMYGDRVAYVSLVTRSRTRPDGNGGRRTCTANEKNYVSAVAVISDHDDKTVLFYHNCFARVPLAAPLFRGENFFHLQKVAWEPWRWSAID